MAPYKTMTLSMDLEKKAEHDSIVTLQLLYSLVLISPFFLGGATMAYPAIALPQMELDIADASWFGSTHALVAPIGSLLVGIAIDRCGRRAALLLTVLPGTVGWFLLYCSPQTAFIIPAQVLVGVTFGAIGYPSLVYAGECVMANHVKRRNYFATWTGLTTSFGTFVAFLLGYFLHHRQIAAILTFVSATSFASIYVLIPESPTWLYLRGRRGDAEWSRRKLGISQTILDRGGGQPATGRDQPSFTTDGPSVERVCVDLKKLARKDVYKPLVIMSLVFVMIMAGGGVTITTYMVTVLRPSATNGELSSPSPSSSQPTANFNVSSASWSMGVEGDAYKYSVVSGGLIFVANLLASVFVVRVGVRKLTAFSLFWAAVGLTLMGYTTRRPPVLRSLAYALHPVSVWLVAFAFNCGPVNVTWGTLGDVFPADAKGFASVCVTIVSAAMAASNKFYPYAFAAYGGHLYYAYASITLAASIFGYFYLPETVGRTLQQINETFL